MALLAILAVGLAYLLLCLLFALPSDRLFTSDTLWPESVLRDFLDPARSIRDFSFPPANSLVDLLAYAFIRLFVPNYSLSLLLLVALQLFAITGGLAVLAWQVLLRPTANADRMLAIALQILGWLCLWLLLLRPEPHSLFTVFVALPVNHSGTFALGLWMAVVWFWQNTASDSGRAIRWYVVYAAGCIVGTFSDHYFWLFPVLPLLLTQSLRPLGRLLRLVVPALLGSGLWVLAKLSGLLILPRPAGSGPALFEGLRTFYLFVLLPLWHTERVLLVFASVGFALLCVFAVLAIVRCVWPNAPGDSSAGGPVSRHAFRPIVFSAAAAVLCFVAPVVLGAFRDAEGLRYMAPLQVFWPLGLTVFGDWLLRRLFGSNAPAIIPAAAGLAAVLLVGSLVGSLVADRRFPRVAMPAVSADAAARCVGEWLKQSSGAGVVPSGGSRPAEPVVYGVADYWQTRPLNLRYPTIRVVAHDGLLRPYPWIANLADIRLAQNPGWKPAFVVAGPLPERQIVTKFGKPRAILRCESVAIYSY